MKGPDVTTRHSRRYGFFFAVGWLLFLVIDVANELTGRHPPLEKLWTVGAAAVFVAVYLAFWIGLYRGGRPTAPPVLLVVLCAIATGLSLTEFETWGGAFVYCAVAAGWAFQWRRSTAATLAVAALAAALGLVTRANLVVVLIDVAITVLAGLAMVSINRLVVGYRELRLAREEMARLAVAEERLRFARDLHDLLGHSLSVIVLKSELAGKLAEAAPDRAAREVHEIERVAREALREVREAVSGYRQASLWQELEGARQALEAAGMSVRVNQRTGPLPAPVDSVLAWAVREGTTNVIRHSGARRVLITLVGEEARAQLEIADDGIGGSVDGEGSGLRGLRERVQARDGTVEFGPGAEGGFQLVVTVPVKKMPEEAAPRT